jgi:hypothetical protein
MLVYTQLLRILQLFNFYKYESIVFGAVFFLQIGLQVRLCVEHRNRVSYEIIILDTVICLLSNLSDDEREGPALS